MGSLMKQWQSLRRHAAALVVMVTVASVSAVAVAQNNRQGTTGKTRLVCWTDNVGNRACGDSVPPQYADREKKILDQSGRVVKVIPGALTDEQRAEKEAQAQRDAVLQREADKQAAYDRALTATYSAPQDIATLRDDRLATIDTQIDLSESAMRRDAVSLAELRSRLPDPESGQKPGVALVKNIELFEQTIAENQRALTELRRKREDLCADSARDIERFQLIKSGSVTYRSPCPLPGSLAAAADKPVDLAAARAFFDRYVELEMDFDPAYLDRYAADAVILVAAGSAPAKPRKVEEWRAEALKGLPAAKAKVDPPLYSEIQVAASANGRAVISGKRATGRGQPPLPFSMVIRPSGPDWQIVEATSATP